MTEINIPYKEAIPGKYERYLGPYLYEPYAIYTKNRIKGSPKIVLEMAAGTGRVTRHIAEKIGNEAKLIATDINPNMLKIARKQVAATNIEFLVADSQDLPFSDNSLIVLFASLDLCFCRTNKKDLMKLGEY